MNPRQVHDALYAHYGPQHWWPADSPFEVMVGAILTQNTAWGNVERAIANLKANHALGPQAILDTPSERLAEWLRPSGYFNIKARRLRHFCACYLAEGGFDGMCRLDTPELRQRLLAVSGIGPETADDILLYAFERPVFVIDAYTRRLVTRLGLFDGEAGYETLRHAFETGLGVHPANVPLFNEYHALIVAHAKAHCRKRPICTGCCMVDCCCFPVAGLAGQ